jgi:hypothetical protein
MSFFRTVSLAFALRPFIVVHKLIVGRWALAQGAELWGRAGIVDKLMVSMLTMPRDSTMFWPTATRRLQRK